VLGQAPAKVRSRIGYVPQYPGFRRDFPITVTDVVRLGQLGNSIQDRDKLSDSLAAAMGAVELDSIADRQIASLSGGQLQRVLIARALACKPEILILDEPTANIDLRAEEDIFGVLKQYNEHMTIIVVSHDIAFISGYVHRVACLNRTLVCHRTEEISGKTIEDLYGAPVKMINHSH
ncbi:MAG: ATP-binding cassette domain-containing protein, partial [Gammaproteobacteria bacterium]